MSVERFDVAIIGAGPAGSSSAILLARSGYSVVLFDKALFPREKLCGDFLNPIDWSLFKRLGMVDELLSVEREEITSFHISNFSGEEATIPFPSQNGEPLSGLGLRRFYLDDLLLRLAAKEGTTIRQGSRIAALRREEDGWSITLGSHSTEERFHSTLLIGADGRNSWVAHRLGLARPSKKPSRFLAFQLHLRGVKRLNGDVQIHLFPGGYAGLVGLGGGVANLCFTVERERIGKGVPIYGLFESCLCENSHLGDSLSGAEIVGKVRSAYPIFFSPRRFYGDGFLLVGDAARVTEPVTGEGVYFALKSGILAAEAMDLAFRERMGSAEQFTRYGRLCQEAFSSRQRINRIIRALIYRPSLLSPLIRLSAKTSFPLRPLVDWLCRAG